MTATEQQAQDPGEHTNQAQGTPPHAKLFRCK
jgi:hypothetical protein